MAFAMENEFHQAMMNNLLSSSLEERAAAIINIKNAVIGDSTKKKIYVELGIIPRLLHLMIQDSDCTGILVESTVILGSLAKVGKELVDKILQTQALPIIVRGLFHDSNDVVIASLRTVRNFYLYDSTPCGPLYEENSAGVIKLVQLLSGSRSSAEYASVVLSKCCKTVEHQMILFSANIINDLKVLLEHKSEKILAPTLSCFAALAYKNGTIAEAIYQTTERDKKLIDVFTSLMSRDKPLNLQFLAAKCITYMSRAGIVSSDSSLIRLKVMPSLARMCKSDKPHSIQYQAADVLSYLLEDDKELQELAMYTDHLLRNVSSYLKKSDLEEDVCSMMRQSSFRIFGALCAHSETIRKKVTEVEPHLINHVVRGLEDSSYGVQYAAAKCLLSFSRSVQQLRTNLSDNEVWKPVWKIVKENKNIPVELLTILSAIICNLLLEFSPARKSLLREPVIDFLSSLVQREEKDIQLNGIWAFMNLCIGSDRNTICEIIKSFSARELFNFLSIEYLQSSDGRKRLIKCLGVLRNMLTVTDDANFVMDLHGVDIMSALRSIILANDCHKDAMEQALCALLNIACAGVAAKDIIAEDSDLLKKILMLMSSEKSPIQVAACSIISNLVSNIYEGASNRRHKLNELGIQTTLQPLLAATCTDSNLFDIIKTIMQQF